ncbi:MAG: DNA-processing protein DprA [Propionibacteriaceae bacterium]|nr:DNA-processing protein DprA [Propionibacteriaceae bacterium]
MDERMARMALSCVVEPATWSVSQAVDEFGAATVWEALFGSSDPWAKKAHAFDPAKVVAAAAQAGIRFVIPADDEWVDVVADLSRDVIVHQLGGMPFGLWVKGGGNLAQLCSKAVSIVGSRAASAYGEHVAGELAYELGQGGVSVISGGAYGIDSAAHRGALASRTPTVAVLAGGLDSSYPPGNAALFDRIAENGVLVSELPPGEHPTRVRFLSRNRLIAALSMGTVVVEAAVRSGARNTLTWANGIGRVTMAVPGSVTNANSYGPHQAIREAAAVLVTNASEVCELIEPLGRQTPIPDAEHRFTDELSQAQLRVYEALPARGSRGADEIAMRAEFALGTTLALLNQLFELNLVWQNPKQEWQLTSAKHRDALLAER